MDALPHISSVPKAPTEAERKRRLASEVIDISLALPHASFVSQAPTEAERKRRLASQITYVHSDWAKAGLWFDKFLIFTILLNTLSFAVSTDEDTIAAYPWVKEICYSIEYITVAIFTLEYVVRLAVIGEHDSYRGVMGLIRYMCTIPALVDLCSIVPFFIDLVTPKDDLPALQFVRLLRLLRIMMMGEYALAFRDM